MRSDTYPRTNGVLLSVFAIILFIASYRFIDAQPATLDCYSILDTFHIGQILLDNTIVSLSLGIVFLLLIAATILYISNYISGKRHFTPLIFLVLALANPSAIYFTPLHIISFLMMWSIFLITMFKLEDGRDSERIFAAFFLYSTCILCFPPMIWFLPVLVIMSAGAAESKAKYILAVFLGIIAPFVLALSILFILEGWEPMEPTLVSFAQAFTFTGEKNIVMSSPFLCKSILILYFTLITVVKCIRESRNMSRIKSTFLFRDIIFLTAAFAFFIVFIMSFSVPFGVVLYAPLSFIFLELAASWGEKGRFLSYYSLFLLILLIERVSLFLQ